MTDRRAKRRQSLGERHYAAILTEAAVLDIRARAAAEAATDLAAEFKVSIWTIKDVVRRATWRHI